MRIRALVTSVALATLGFSTAAFADWTPSAPSGKVDANTNNPVHILGYGTVYRALVNPGVYRDPDTGCQYIVIKPSQSEPGQSAGITPRLGTDGKPICGTMGLDWH